VVGMTKPAGMTKQHVYVKVSQGMWREYRAMCASKGITVTDAITAMIAKEVTRARAKSARGG